MSVPMRVDDVFSSAAREAGDAVQLLLADGTPITYAQTYERAARLAGALVSAGVCKDDRVAGLMRNSREIVEFYIACGLAGVIGVAINAMSTEREIDRILADCGASAIVTEARMLERVLPGTQIAAMRLRVVTRQDEAPRGWETYDALLARSKPLHARADASPDDAAMMIYSSGTTGAPKGILLRHSALVYNARMTSQVLGTGSTDRYLAILPMFSSFGHAFDFLQAGLVRASTVLLEQFDERLAVDCIERLKVTFIAGVPTMFARMFDPANIAGRDISSLRLIDVGGGPVAPRLKQMLHDEYGLEVVESYGLTEISPVASVQPPGGNNSIGSCGAPLPGIEVRVIALDGTPAPMGEAGELQFRSPTLMIGYWNQPEATASALRDGWLRSGDVGKLDEQGHIHILDRTKDMIVSNGFNVYPKEVENVIAELPGVQSVAVVGVPHEISGEWIQAFVVSSPDSRLSEEEVLQHCTRALASFKRPKRVTFVDAMPLTGSGKIRRVALRELLANERIGEKKE